MSALRLLAALLSFVICFLYGKVKSARDKKKLDELYGLVCDVKTVETLVKTERLQLDEIVKGLSVSGENADLWTNVYEGISAGTSVSEAVKLAFGKTPDNEVKALILRLFDNEASREPEAFSAVLSDTAEKLESAYESKKKRSLEKDRLTGSLSVFAGLAAAILIL